MRNKEAKRMAFGGVLAALAVVIMCLGGLIPVATYVCPALCMLILSLAMTVCGRKTAWAWYGAVALLCLLMAPDREAAAVFAFLGYYPLLKEKMDALPLRWLWKGLYFNAAILVMYSLLIWLFGMAELAGEFGELGAAMLAVLLLLGNLVFFLLDKALTRFGGGRK